MVASITPLPVISVPVKTSSLDGMDSLYLLFKMPEVFLWLLVAINNAKNAGILATQILGVKDKELRRKVEKYKDEMRDEVRK